MEIRYSKTDLKNKYDELNEFIMSLETSIIGDRTNRTLVHEALYYYQNRWINVRKEIERLEDSIENVTLNKLDWEYFVFLADFTIPVLKKKLEILKHEKK